MSAKFFTTLRVTLWLCLASFSGVAQSDTNRDEMSQSELKVLRDFVHLTDSEKIIASHRRLQNLIQMAVDNSPSIKEARFNIDAANEDIAAARGARLPQVNATAQSRYTSTPTVSSNRLLGNPGVTVSANMALYDWGKIDAQIKGRESALDGSSARFQLQSRQVTLEVTSTCIELTKQRALLAVNQEYLQSVKKLVDMLVKVTKADPGRSGEQLQARSRLLQAESSSQTTRSKIRETRIQLERLAGEDGSNACEGIGAHLLIQPELELIRTALGQHPQIVALDADYQQQLRQLDQIRASRKPQVQLGASYGPVNLGITNEYANIVSLTVTAPLYDGNILRSNERAALERANASGEKIEQAKRQLDADYLERYAKASSDLRRAEEYVSLLEVNDRVRNDFFLQWTALGRRSLFELLAIEAEQFSLQSGYVSALFDGMSGHAAVLATAGLITAGLTGSAAEK